MGYNKIITIITISVFSFMLYGSETSIKDNKSTSKNQTVDFSFYPIWFSFDKKGLNSIINDYGYGNITEDQFKIAFDIKIGTGVENLYIGLILANGLIIKNKKSVSFDDRVVTNYMDYNADYIGLSVSKSYPFNKKFVFSSSFMAGYCMQKISLTDTWLSTDLHQIYTDEIFIKKNDFIVEPKLELSYIILDWLSFFLGTGYMYSLSGSEWQLHNDYSNKVISIKSNSNLNGLTISIGPKFNFSKLLKSF
jgi:hypothetical protein